jgi:hypothetical protein
MTLTLTAQAAAAYVGFGGKDPATQFRNAVKKGALPPAAITCTRPHLWSRAQLDNHLSAANNEASQSDSLMVKINGIR